MGPMDWRVGEVRRRPVVERSPSSEQQFSINATGGPSSVYHFLIAGGVPTGTALSVWPASKSDFHQLQWGGPITETATFLIIRSVLGRWTNGERVGRPRSAASRSVPLPGHRSSRRMRHDDNTGLCLGRCFPYVVVSLLTGIPCSCTSVSI